MFFPRSYLLNIRSFGLKSDKLGNNMPFVPFLTTSTPDLYRVPSNTKKMLNDEVELITDYITYFLLCFVFVCAL